MNRFPFRSRCYRLKQGRCVNFCITVVLQYCFGLYPLCIYRYWNEHFVSYWLHRKELLLNRRPLPEASDSEDTSQAFKIVQDMFDIHFNIILLSTPKSPNSVLARAAIATFIVIRTIQFDSLITQNCTSLCFPYVTSTKFVLCPPVCLVFITSPVSESASRILNTEYQIWSPNPRKQK